MFCSVAQEGYDTMYLLGLCFSTDAKVSVEKRNTGRTVRRTSRLRSLGKMPLWTLVTGAGMLVRGGGADATELGTCICKTESF